MFLWYLLGTSATERCSLEKMSLSSLRSDTDRCEGRIFSQKLYAVEGKWASSANESHPNTAMTPTGSTSIGICVLQAESDGETCLLRVSSALLRKGRIVECHRRLERVAVGTIYRS
jgi:hypothetical protein